MIRRKLLFHYIRLLEWYLDLPSITQQTNTTEEFMANAWKHSGYREYSKKRNENIVYEAAGGDGLAIIDRAKYAELIGRRLENLQLASYAKKCFELQERRLRQKLSNNSVDTPKE